MVPDMRGERFGALVVLERATNVGAFVTWNCKCDCGNEKAVKGNSLRTGRTKSCGCQARALQADKRRIHGHSGANISATYRSWSMMKNRCLNSNAGNFEYYGGRGITVCERWMIFDEFLADMGERPIGKTLDRYPNKDGNYEPGNCRWATAEEQSNNRRLRKSLVRRRKTTITEGI